MSRIPQALLEAAARDAEHLRIIRELNLTSYMCLPLLTIQGKAKHTLTSEPISREYELGNFFRQFELSEQVDQGKIAARFQHGVLTLQLPRAEKAKPRQIAVQVAS